MSSSELESNASTLHEMMNMPKDFYLSFGDKQFENQLKQTINKLQED